MTALGEISEPAAFLLVFWLDSGSAGFSSPSGPFLISSMLSPACCFPTRRPRSDTTPFSQLQPLTYSSLKSPQTHLTTFSHEKQLVHRIWTLAPICSHFSRKKSLVLVFFGFTEATKEENFLCSGAENGSCEASSIIRAVWPQMMLLLLISQQAEWLPVAATLHSQGVPTKTRTDTQTAGHRRTDPQLHEFDQTDAEKREF